MIIYIVCPKNAHKAYRYAAEIFAELASKVSSAECIILNDQEPIPDSSDPIVVIGTDSVNNLAAKLYLARDIDDFGIRYGTDEYRIYTRAIGEHTYIFFAGGRPRSTLYAVYRYFEKFCGCRWFWDGDRITTCELPMDGIDLTESPRFEYRGIRYFAHRSLHRFQAEHWNFEDWQKEIDWMLKKRLNLFMLRIGLDDLFQKAFPDVVPYPKLGEPLPEAGSDHHDRNLFWSLEYRGELRKKLLTYAFEHDLMHPEDCGTVTHWYSRTPKAYLETVKPKLLIGSKYNGELTGQTWDVLDDENLANYFKLTDAHIREYGKPEIFHTIGLAERSFSEDKEVNMRLKLYVYRRICANLKEKYPNAPLLIASWDLWGWFDSQNTNRLLSELDPKQAIIFDYTSDTKCENNFTEWGVIGKFPWIFGMFSGYEPDSDIRGFYDWTNERIKIAKDDPMCKGVILWAELSHGDTLMTEYLSHNAWDAETVSIAEFINTYCADRYTDNMQETMHKIWNDFMPIVQMRSWNPINSKNMAWGQDTFVRLADRARFEDKPFNYYGRSPEDGAAHQDEAVRVLQALSEITTDDEMLRRDICDIARTVLGRYTDCAVRLAEIRYIAHDNRMYDAMKSSLGLMKALCGLYASHKDYSLLETIRHLERTTEINPNFEITLKRNASGYYCRSHISENASYLYLPEMKIIFDEVKKASVADVPIDREAVKKRIESNTKRYFEIPLSEMKCDDDRTLPQILREASEIIRDIQFN